MSHGFFPFSPDQVGIEECDGGATVGKSICSRSEKQCSSHVDQVSSQDGPIFPLFHLVNSVLLSTGVQYYGAL